MLRDPGGWPLNPGEWSVATVLGKEMVARLRKPSLWVIRTVLWAVSLPLIWTLVAINGTLLSPAHYVRPWASVHSLSQRNSGAAGNQSHFGAESLILGARNFVWGVTVGAMVSVGRLVLPAG